MSQNEAFCMFLELPLHFEEKFSKISQGFHELKVFHSPLPQISTDLLTRHTVSKMEFTTCQEGHVITPFLKALCFKTFLSLFLLSDVYI